ncbi:MAG: glycosyltransferase [Adlercreutzia sp.]|nr:glycosyltransferase [Adlercreutzia sp.]
MAKVCHVSSAHDPHDVRILIKECRSLAKAGHDVSFVVFGESELYDNVNIVGLGDPPLSRKDRMTKGAKKAIERAVGLGADIYHLHDPELLIYASSLRSNGAKVVFDSHEDVPAQILSKPWIPAPARKLVSKLYSVVETRAMRNIDAVVAATPFIAGQFADRVPVVTDVNNYPLLDDVDFQERPFEDRDAVACYVGGISDIRGKDLMVSAMEGLEGSLVLAGPCEGDVPVSEGVEYVGILDRSGVNDLYGRSVVGLVMLKPTANYLNSRPIKMYEYMAAGLPVVASDFPAWREVIEETQCGLCVDPYNHEAAKMAIQTFLHDRLRAQRMGRNGRLAVERKYNWACEEGKLLDLYRNLLSIAPTSREQND